MHFLLVSSLAMSAFYALYWVLFRRLTFYSLNRAYLLTALGLSLLIPLIPVPVRTMALVQSSAPVIASQPVVNQVIDSLISSNQPLTNQANSFDWSQLIQGAYGLVAFLFALRFAHRLWTLRRLSGQEGEEFDNLLIVPTSGPNASFFRLILLNQEGLTSEERALVLAHEAEHARRWHSLDRLALEVITIVFWANPVVYLYAHSLAQLHELEVDAALAEQCDRRVYARLILKIVQSPTGFINAFSRRPLQNRIYQLVHAKPSIAMKKNLYFLFVPVAALVMWACQPELKSAGEAKNPDGETWVIDHPERLGDVPTINYTLNEAKLK